MEGLITLIYIVDLIVGAIFSDSHSFLKELIQTFNHSFFAATMYTIHGCIHLQKLIMEAKSYQRTTQKINKPLGFLLRQFSTIIRQLRSLPNK